MTPTADQLPTLASAPRQRSILPCDFRSAGWLSNDSIRNLRTLHETFARTTGHSLDLFLGSTVEVKMLGIEQLELREFTASLSSMSYVVPCATAPMPGNILLKLENTLLFPLLDLLLGGTGDPLEAARELTDIDEELIQSVTELVTTQLERTWKDCKISLAPSASVKPALVSQMFAADERAVIVQLEITVASTTGSLKIAIPTAFANALVRASQTETNARNPGPATPSLGLRERLLDCIITVAADLPNLRISVGDLVGLKPGTLLNLGAPVKTAVKLTVHELDLFEVTPVRRGGRKSAQLGRSCRNGKGA